MLNLATLEKYDLSGMHKIYDRWPQIAKEAYESDLEPIDFENIDHIVLSGIDPSPVKSIDFIKSRL